MFIFLVPVFFISLWLIIFNRRREKGIRRAFLETSLVFFAFIAVVTEFFSLFNGITALNFILTWSAAVLILWGKFFREIKTGALHFKSDFWEKIKTAPKFYLILALFIYLVTLVIALVSPPNTYDSMTYHLARVAHWIQNGTVAHYPTAILRQLYQPPLSEYGILHFQLLAGNDHFANLVQWFALPAGGATGSLIVKEFGQNTKMQCFAVLLCATIPAAIIQSTGTQNDLFVSFFVLAFFYFWLAAVKSGSWRDFVWTGLALGLAILTKGSAYVFCFPVGLFFTVVHFLALKDKPARLRFIRQVAVVLLIALSFNLAHYARNTRLFGSPVSTGDEQLSNKNLTVKMAFSNLARNYVIHLGTTSKNFDRTIENAMKRVFGDELKNPDSTWMADDFGFEVKYSTHEDHAGNFVHILLITLALLLIFWVRGDERRYLYGAAFTIVFGYVLFSLLLKWQIWGSRLQLPLFMLGACLVAAVIARLLPRAAILVAVLCFVVAWSFLFYSAPRRVLSNEGKFVLFEPRPSKYFKNLPDLEPFYTEASNFIKSQPAGADKIGLFIDYNEYEYPLWILLKKDFAKKPIIYHVGVRNVSAKLARARAMPEYIISTRTEKTIENVEYTEVWLKDPVRVLRKKETNAP
jgi:4-amino-4-deoxy-L-arabinose transferase-like glycosyltransferase